jgi:hypothetical protein
MGSARRTHPSAPSSPCRIFYYKRSLERSRPQDSSAAERKPPPRRNPSPEGAACESPAREVPERIREGNESCGDCTRLNYIQSLILLPVPLPSIPESQSNPNQHKSHRRNQQHQHRPVQRLLPLFRRAARIRIAHRTTLAECRHCANANHRNHHKNANSVQNKFHRVTSRPTARPAPHPGKRRNT